MLTRRRIVASGAGLLVTGCASAQVVPPVAAPPVQPERVSDATQRFRWVADHVGGRLGVCAIDTGSGRSIGYRAGQRFAMASTFKWLLAAGILKRVQHGMSLEDETLFNRDDLLGHSPVCETRIDPETGIGRMTLEELCEATVTVSDNCAANLLLVPMMGPEGLTRFFREAGDSVTRLDRNEPSLNENAPGDERDTTTPEAMAQTAARVLAGDGVLRPVMRDKLIGWMRASTTGLDRLRAGLPATWNAGDKTGTGGNGSHNDVAIAFPPGRAPIVIASYISESTAPNGVKAAAHAEVARIVTKEFGVMAAKKQRKVDIKSKKTVYKGRYKVDEYVFDFDRAAGKGRLKDVTRLVFERGDSAAALIHDVERDVIVLAEQFRIATYDKGPGYIVEAMAGSVEEDEEPEDCIRREMLEEVGYRADKLTLVSQGYVSPGSSSERIFLYYAPVKTADLVDPKAAGVAAEKEDVRRVEFTREDFLDRVDAAFFDDAKVMALGFWLKAQPKQGKPKKR